MFDLYIKENSELIPYKKNAVIGSSGNGNSCNCSTTPMFSLEIDNDGNLIMDTFSDSEEMPVSFYVDSDGNLVAEKEDV